jgi:hypothetical protein
MSSGTNANVAEVGNLLRADQETPAAHSARQKELNRLWEFYRCNHYASRKLTWDGLDHAATEAAAAMPSGSYVPPGFYDASAQMAPVHAKRPTAPYHLAKVIVNRFTGLLFGSKRHPKIVVQDDPETERWLNSFAEATRLWARMTQARTYGGAMGATAVGFVFKQGVPKLEVHDPRFCMPEFSDREELVVDCLEKRYQYADTVRDPASGMLVEARYWYRRVIDDKTDTVWPKVPVAEDDSEPVWKNYRCTVAEHGFGFCPVVWIQNTEVQESLDGDADCHGTFETIQTIDALIAQANRGILANCDPTLVLSTPDELESALQKGSDNAIKMTAGNATYLEISGAGPKAAQELADRLEARVLRITRCVLDDNFGGPARTSQEVEQNYSNMIEQADVLREQYGERGVKRLLEMVLFAARKLATPRIAGEGEQSRVVRSLVRLPKTKDGVPRELGAGELIELDWPDWYEPSLDDTNKAVTAASSALTGGLVDKEHAVRFIAHYFNVENVSELVGKLDEAEAAANAPVDQSFDTTVPDFTGDSVDPADFAYAPLEEVPPVAPLPEDSFNPEVVESVAAEEALNGAQVKALIEILEKVYASTLPAAAAREVILGAFPTIAEDAVDRMLATAPAVTPKVETSPDAVSAEPVEEAV